MPFLEHADTQTLKRIGINVAVLAAVAVILIMVVDAIA